MRQVRRIAISIAMALLASLVVFVLAAYAFPTAFPTGWRIPFYNDGRALISNGPGEWLHTGPSAQAIDFLAMDTWASTKDVRSPFAGTVKLATTYTCPGKTVGVQDSASNGALYFHLASWSVSVGQSVARGQVIADYDTTGLYPDCISGAHLHFEGRNSINWSNPLNTGTPLVIKDLRGIGWYPWWPNVDRYSGFVVQSTSHSVTSCSTDRTIDVRWPLASGQTWPGHEFVDGYSWSWTTSSTSIPDTTKDGEETVQSTTSSSLAVGTWWFHLRVRDTSGNWTVSGDVAHLGPFCLN